MYLAGHTYGCVFGALGSSMSGSLTYALLIMGVFAAYSGYIVTPDAIPKPLLFIVWLNPLYLGYIVW